MRQSRIASIALIAASLCVAAAHPQAGKDVDGLIDYVFGNLRPPTTSPKTPSGGLEDSTAGVFTNNNENTNNGDQGNNNDKTGVGGTFLGKDNTGNTNDCECVPYYQCQNGTILEDGVGLIDIRSGFKSDKPEASQSVSGACENYLDICCKPPNIVTPEEKITPVPLAHKGCGHRNAQGVGFRITGDTDNEAQFGEFPWMVAILNEQALNEKVLNLYRCGGALITPRAVLTAAHCVNGTRARQLKIRAGEWDTQTKTEIYPHQDRKVSQVIIHERFHPTNLRNDFAVLILEKAVDLADNVDLVCLPESTDLFDLSRCFVSGWGKDVYGKEGKYQAILKRIEVPVVNSKDCQVKFRRTRLGKHFVLDPSFICAGGEPGKDACNGDGGSPLVCPIQSDPTRYVQAGIVAWGIDCGTADVPGVYANVARARRWIDEQVAYNNLDTTVYQYA